MSIWAEETENLIHYIKRWGRWVILIVFFVITQLITSIVLGFSLSAEPFWNGILIAFWSMVLAILMVIMEFANPDWARIADVIFRE